MKKTLLFISGALLTLNVSGQNLTQAPSKPVINTAPSLHSVMAAKTTHIDDSILMVNVLSTDTNTNYYISHTGLATDSGFLGGTNGFGYKGFAERYDFNGTDSTVKIIGIVSLFGGRVNSASTKTVTFKAWSPAAATVIRPTLSYSGFPGSGLDSIVGVSVRNLGIGTTADSFKSFYFATPTAYLSSSFFVGYTINYNFNALAGDTIGLQTTRLGERTSPEFNVVSGDTIVNDQNAILDTSGGSDLWLDVWANLGFKLDFYIFPIVDAQFHTTSVSGITRNNLTYFGTYPNPAVNNTNVRFSLDKATDVSIFITDMSGRVIKTINQNNQGVGEHTIAIETSDLSAGNYLCVLHTASGDGIASKLTIAK